MPTRSTLISRIIILITLLPFTMSYLHCIPSSFWIMLSPCCHYYPNPCSILFLYHGTFKLFLAGLLATKKVTRCFSFLCKSIWQPIGNLEGYWGFRWGNRQTFRCCKISCSSLYVLQDSLTGDLPDFQVKNGDLIHCSVKLHTIQFMSGVSAHHVWPPFFSTRVCFELISSGILFTSVP